MIRRSWLPAIAVVLVGATVPGARANTITMEVSPSGKTQNQNLYGTTLSSGSATWPGTASRYRDYQFNLQTSSGTASFNDFAVRLSASRNNSTAPTNTLRASLWSGPITPNPDLMQAITTVTIANSFIPTSGYADVLLTGNPFSPQTIGIAPSTFFFRVWAEGDGGSTGFYQTKMAELPAELQAVTMLPDPAIDGSIGIDTDGNGSFDLNDPITEVPEIDPAGFGSVAALLAGALGLIERRRLKAKAA